MSEAREMATRVVKRSLGNVEVCVVLTEDGILAGAAGHENPGVDPEVLAAMFAVSMSALEFGLADQGLPRPDRMDLKIGDRHFVVRRKGGHYVVAYTKRRPNLGLVYLVLDSL